MNPFAARSQARSQLEKEKWVIPVTLMCCVLGFMVELAWVTPKNRDSRYPLLNSNQKPRITEGAVDYEAFMNAQAELRKLQAEKTKLENAIGQRNDQTKVINDNLQDAKMLAGLTPLEGPGLVVTLKDSAKAATMEVLARRNYGTKVPADLDLDMRDFNIHDTDVLFVVNDLFNAGAEAVSVNGNRISGLSSIHCIGNTVAVNDIKIAPPIVIRAIGDSQVLQGGIEINGGAVSNIRVRDSGMAEIAVAKKLLLPAFTGKTSFRFATVSKEKETH